MKRILTTALAVVLFVGASQAQDVKDKGRHHGDKKEMAMQQLDLTADQKARLQAIREAQKTEMQALKKSGNVTPEQRKAIHEKFKAQYQAVLTPAQQEQLKKQKEQWKEKGEKKKGFGKKGQQFKGQNMGRQAAFFKKELNLSADQETRLKSIFQNFKTQAQTIRSNNSLTQEQKKEQMQSLGKQQMDQAKAVLNAEQLKKLEEMKGKRKGKRNTNL